MRKSKLLSDNMSVITLNSEQVAELHEEEYYNPAAGRELKHTKWTRWHMVFMAILFITQFALSVMITYLLYENSYHQQFWISTVFVIIFYFIGICLGCMAITSQAHDSFLLCILFLLCGIMVIPLLLPIIICIFCIKEALQNYSKIQLMVNVIPLCTYITAQFIFTLTILSDHGIVLKYKDEFNDVTSDFSWFIPLSIFVCILYYIDVFALILFHGGHVLFQYFKSALFILTTFCLELLLITMYIMIRFYVDRTWDTDLNDKLIIFGFINYIIISLPLSSIFFIWRWIHSIENHTYINALVASSLCVKMECLYDRFYAYVHLLSHTALPRKSMKKNRNHKDYYRYDVNYNISLDDLSSSLLSSKSKNDEYIIGHCNADNTCFRYQFEYFGLDLSMKKKYIHTISNGKLPYLSIYKRFRLYSINKCRGSSLIKFVYICSRIYSYLFPLYWFFYVYLLAQHEHNNLNNKSFSNWIIDDHNKYEHIFVVGIMILYMIFFAIFVKMIYIFCRIEYYYGYIMGMKIDWRAIDHFSRCLQRNKIVNEYVNNYKISCIIISYLKNNDPSYNWIFSTSLPRV